MTPESVLASPALPSACDIADEDHHRPGGGNSIVSPNPQYPAKSVDRPALSGSRAKANPLAVDLHAHSRYAYGVSPLMTLENIIPCAQRKGLDILGTGDCLQPDWLYELQTKTVEIGSGLLMLRQEINDECAQRLPVSLRRAIRFVLSTEVCCAPNGRNRPGKLHHLLYFRSFASVRRFQSRIARFGNLNDGRPTLAMTSKDLLALVIEHGEGCVLAPAHVLSPWNSSLGSVDGDISLEAVFGDLALHIQVVEMGSTATPSMCRRLSTLRHRPLFCSSDAHSLGNIGREYTLLDTEPTYDAIMAGLRDPRASRIRGFVKFPSEHTRNYYNACVSCDGTFGGQQCPRCGGALVIGSHDRARSLANDGPSDTNAPRCQQLFPLPLLLGSLLGLDAKNQRVLSVYERLLDALGNERRILTDATEAEIADSNTTGLARAIVRQRTSPPPAGPTGQLRLEL